MGDRMRLSHRSKRYNPCECGGSRQHPRVIVIHSTEGGTAEGAAAYLENRTDGSAHVVVDNTDTFMLRRANRTTCGCAGFNQDVYHIEQAGYAAWKRPRWLRNLPTVRRAAYCAARVAKQYNIPVRWLSPQELRQGKSGITSHLNVTLSKVGTTTHTDPGKGYPKHTFMAFVRRYVKR